MEVNPMRTIFATFFFVILCLSAFSRADERPASQPPALDKIAAPVVYEELMLILSTKEGNAAIAFGKDIEEGVTYRYRFLRKGADKESTGKGKVFEKYERVPKKGPHGEIMTTVIDRGSELFITAGSIKLEWSYSCKGRGWVYYYPEQVRVQIADAKSFEKIDLKRFGK
jgi:hypothetical protein